MDSTSVIIRYTLVGDGNLDGVVNAQDFDVLASNFGKSGRTWTNGDYTGDGIVNTADFNALAKNYNQILPAQDLRTRSRAYRSRPCLPRSYSGVARFALKAGPKARSLEAPRPTRRQWTRRRTTDILWRPGLQHAGSGSEFSR